VRLGQGDAAKALADCQKAVELIGANTDDAAADQGLVAFINGSYESAVASWQKAIQHDPNVQRELQPWIEKAKAKLMPGK